MKIQSPQIPEALPIAKDFLSLAFDCLEEECAVEMLTISEQTMQGERFTKLDHKRCVFEGCTLTDCDFTGASFIDVLFRGCNLANIHFTDGYFSRCRFEQCKCVGADFSGAVARQVTMQGCNLQYCCFDHAKLNDLQWLDCDLTESTLSEVKWKNIEAARCRFIRTGFFKTPLQGFDFTQNELLAPLCSAPPAELRGAKVTLLQAAELAGLLGVIVER